MYLPPDQSARFYRIWFALMNYVNARHQLVEYFPAEQGKETVAASTVKVLRDALWADDTLRTTFIAENPAGLPPADLALVESWRDRRADDFFLMRHLRRHTIFLSKDSPAHAYGVLGLVCPIAEIVGPEVPLYVRAVLLPWEGQIIYDSLLQPYSISFGSGYRSDLNAAYKRAREREGIITSLGPAAHPGDAAAARQGVEARNGRIINAFRGDLARRGLSTSTVDRHVERIAAFAQALLLGEDPPRGLLELTPEDVRRYLADAPEADVTSLKRFVRFLWETDRIDPDQEAALRHQLTPGRR